MPKTTNENRDLKEEEVTTKVASEKASPKTKSATSKSSTSKSTSNKTTKGTTTKSKTTANSTATKKTDTTKAATTKKAETKNTGEKKETAKAGTTTAKKTTAGEKKTNAKNDTEKASKKTEVAKEKKSTSNQATIIEKIKSFLAKIVAMQNEAAEEEAKEEKVAKEKKPKKEKDVTVKTDKQTPYMLEYYDLPYRYNETVVKILAQTPKRLFVYWDISDKDREKYVKAFGDKFFEETYPVLLVHNEEMNYTFEVPINDFANSWYLDINDTKSKYVIQLGRKFKTKPKMVNIANSNDTQGIIIQNDYVPISTSNVLEMPNDHILFENLSNKVRYRNVKTNNEYEIDLSNEEFAKRMGKVYTIYDVYKEIYKNEIDDESLTNLSNPSSRAGLGLFNPSSMSSSKMGRS